MQSTNPQIVGLLICLSLFRCLKSNVLLDIYWSFMKPNFADFFKCIVNRFNRAGYTLDIMRQAACLVYLPNFC